jgi:HSP20 family protein
MAENKRAPAQPAQEQHTSREQSRDQSIQRRPWRGEAGLSPAGMFAGSPFQMLRRMTEEMDRAFERMFDDAGFGRLALSRPFGASQQPGASIWSPRVEAFQKQDKFIVRAELPGLKKDDVEVNVTEDAITIHGQRKEEHERNEEGFYHSERSYGTFYRTIPLPEGVISDSAEATFKDGVLEVRLQAPPNEVSKGRRIDIKE